MSKYINNMKKWNFWKWAAFGIWAGGFVGVLFWMSFSLAAYRGAGATVSFVLIFEALMWALAFFALGLLENNIGTQKPERKIVPVKKEKQEKSAQESKSDTKPEAKAEASNSKSK